MTQQSAHDLRLQLTAWSADLKVLRQNRLLNENSFIQFAKDRGLAVSGTITGDPGDFYKRGWLPADGQSSDGSPLFHLFRIYTLYKILDASELRVLPSATLSRDRILQTAASALS